MERMKISEIVNAVKGELISGDSQAVIETITTDSRQTECDLFIALKGDNFDGNDFAQRFLEEGGKAVITERAIAGECVIRVQDTKAALRDLAAYYRSLFDALVVGVTGSVGKTSTKDMLYCVLDADAPTHKTQGNFNNEIGLPLTVFGVNREHKYAVLEMGMNNFGEISRLTAIAKPSAAVITNIGTAHIGNLGGKEGILKAKLEILEGLSPKGAAILNGDDPMLWSLKGKLPYNTLFYGIDNLNSDLVATDIILGNDKTKFKIIIGGIEYVVTINVVGIHHVYNALAAVLTGINYGLEPQKIIDGISRFSMGSMRQQVTNAGGVRIVEDCYNASTQSVEASLKVLKQLASKGRSIAVLGDMSEMGDFASKAHTELGKAVAEQCIDVLVTVGEYARFIAAEAAKNGVMTVSFQNNQEALTYLTGVAREGDTVLFKGSRVMKLEEISKELIERLG